MYYHLPFYQKQFSKKPIKEIFEKFPNLRKVNEVIVGMSILEEWENEDTYLQIIDDTVMLLEHQNEYLIDNL